MSLVGMVIIMTTDIYKILSPNLFVENESLLFDPTRASHLAEKVPMLAAITFVATRSDSHQTLEGRALAAGSAALSLLTNAFPRDYRLWLFVVDGPLRNPSALSRHQKLWKGHRDLVGSSDVVRIGEEFEIKSEGLVRYAGLLEISCDSCDKAISAARTNSSFAIIFSKRDDIDSQYGVRSIFSAAFPKGSGQTAVDWLSLAINLCPQEDILVRITGLFDDREAAADLIGVNGAILRVESLSARTDT
jgi:hypothetical protein